MFVRFYSGLFCKGAQQLITVCSIEEQWEKRCNTFMSEDGPCPFCGILSGRSQQLSVFTVGDTATAILFIGSVLHLVYVAVGGANLIYKY